MYKRLKLRVKKYMLIDNDGIPVIPVVRYLKLIDLFDDYAYEVLDELEIDTNFVFIKLTGPNKGEPLDYIAVSSLFKRLKHKIGIDVHAHLFRHTHATIYYNQTKDIKQVQERLGHTQIQTTMNIYVHPSEDKKRTNGKIAQPASKINKGGTKNECYSAQTRLQYSKFIYKQNNFYFIWLYRKKPPSMTDQFTLNILITIIS